MYARSALSLRYGSDYLCERLRTHYPQVLAAPNAYIYICFFFMLGRRASRLVAARLLLSSSSAVYSNSLFATLNARHSTADADSHGISFGNSSGSRTHRSQRSGGVHVGQAAGKDITINIEQTTEHNRDNDVVSPAGDSLLYGGC